MAEPTSTAPTEPATASDPTPTTSAAAPAPAEPPALASLAEVTEKDTPAEPEPGQVPTADTPTAPAPEPTKTQETAELTEADRPPMPEPEAMPTAGTAIATTPPTVTAGTSTPTATAAPEKPIDSKQAEDYEEPQNALTKKFTDAEWKALKEFRAELPDILIKAYGESKPSSTTLWGVPLIEPSPTYDARTSVILMKFLRARNLNPAAAKDMLVETLRWRDEFKVNELENEEFDEKVFGGLGKNFGKDRDGRPITWNLYGANKDLKAVFGDVQKFIRWRVRLMERAVVLLDFENVDQMVQVHDYFGVSMRDRDQNSKNAASEATSIFGSHYPETLYKKYFINVPGFLTWIFWAFKAIIPSATFAKMSVVGGGEKTIHKALSECIADDQIPRKYGGGADDF